MPRLFELQRSSLRPMRHVEPLLERTDGEESLVVDERSCRSSSCVVEEKLSRLTETTAQFIGGFSFQRESC